MANSMTFVQNICDSFSHSNMLVLAGMFPNISVMPGQRSGATPLSPAYVEIDRRLRSANILVAS